MRTSTYPLCLLSVKEEEHLNILGEKDVAPVGRWKVLFQFSVSVSPY